jgi:hypothetical protein
MCEFLHRTRVCDQNVIISNCNRVIQQFVISVCYKQQNRNVFIKSKCVESATKHIISWKLELPTAVEASSE